LNEGATGTKQLPDYCKVWFTKEFSAKDVIQYIKDPSSRKLRPKEKINSSKMIEAHTLKLFPFRYYNTMSWITRTIRAHKNHVLDMNFLMNDKVQRYHNLYNKLYIGYMSVDEAKKILDLKEEYTPEQRVIIAIEKKHSDEISVTYYIQKARKNLYLYSFDDNDVMTKEKKDPYGITVTEVYHASKMMDGSYELNVANIRLIEKLLKEHYQKTL